MEYKREYLEYLLDNIPYMVQLLDVDLRCKYINELGSRYLRSISKYDYTREQFINCSMEELLIDSKMWPNIKPSLQTVLKEKKPIAKKFVQEEGIYTRCFEWNVVPIIEEDGEVKNIVSILHRTDMEGQLEEIMSETAKITQNLYTIIDVDYREKEIKDILRKIVMQTGKSIKGDNVLISIYSEKNCKWETLFTRNVSNSLMCYLEAQNFSLKELKPLYSSEKKPYQEVCSLSNKVLRYVLQIEGIPYIAIYPIKLADKIIGMLSIGYENAINDIYFQYRYLFAISQNISTLLVSYLLMQNLKEESEKREEIEKKFEMFFNHAIDFLCILDKDGYIQRVNNVWQNTLGYKREAFIGKRINDFMHKEDACKCKKMLEQVLEEDSVYESIERYRCQDNTYRYISFHSKHVITEKYSVILRVGRDITEELQVEKEKIQMKIDIEKEKIKNQFFATLSHEFKTPLNIILTTMQLLDKGMVKNEIEEKEEATLKRYGNLITKNTYKILKIANNLIDLTKLDTGAFQLNRVNIDIINVVEEMVQSVISYIHNDCISITFDTTEEEHIICCDKECVERMVLNLLANAIKNIESKGRILVKVKVVKTKVIITIKDNGMGIDSEEIEQLFSNKKPVNKTAESDWIINGLGLKIVKRLAELHKGSIYIVSKYRKGTKVIIELPNKRDKKYSYTTYDIDRTWGHKEKCKVELGDL